MEDMTWDDFKKEVDAKMAEQGIPSNTQIWYIDISFPTKCQIENGDITVTVDEDCGLAI